MKQQNKSRPKSIKDSGYKIKNWKAYNQALKQRGSLETWILDEIADQWYFQGVSQRGGQYKYSDACIEMAATIRAVYHLPYRQLEGFLTSLINQKGWAIKSPDYTVIQRRIKKLKITVSDDITPKENIYVVMDSTGLKVYGEGEWKVRQHGWGKHRTWMKLHVAVDEATSLIENCIMTTNSVDDAAMVEPLLSGIKGKVKRLAGDGAYDKHKVYKALAKRKIKPIIPPRKGARIKKHGNKKGKPLERDKTIRAIRKLGRKGWKIRANYHRRSIAETTMFRIKLIFGGELKSRVIQNQEIEVILKCKILNRMTALGMPIAYKIKAA